VSVGQWSKLHYPLFRPSGPVPLARGEDRRFEVIFAT